MTEAEIIGKILRDMEPMLLESEPAYEEVVIAELNRRLPETEIKTCEDFPT